MGLFLAMITLLMLAACGGSDDTGNEPSAPEPTEAPAPTEIVEPTRPPTTVEEQPTSVEEETPTEPAAEPESQIPFDVPIMENATKLDVQESVGTVTYVVEDTDLDTVVEFYETEMTVAGWESKTSSLAGLMASLVFETDVARTSVSLQANNIAETVTVRLFMINK